MIPIFVWFCIHVHKMQMGVSGMDETLAYITALRLELEAVGANYEIARRGPCRKKPERSLKPSFGLIPTLIVKLV